VSRIAGNVKGAVSGNKKPGDAAGERE
jgi:hypothetical protein